MARRAGDAVLRVVRSAAVAASPTDRELLAEFTAGDEAAFAALVQRHAGMVLGVCRRVLPNVQDAEDACQAVFLILAGKASRERWQPSIANWLYTTARRVAAKATRAASRRAERESRATPAASESPLDQMTGREAFAALDEELDKLPTIYREPLVLCYLEGLTRDEAATRLGVPAATLKSQLDRGRKKLGDALTKRGVALGAGLLAVAVTSPAGASPPRLVESVLAAVSGSPSAAARELAKGVAVSGSFNKAVLALAAVGAVALGAGLGAVGASATGDPPRAESKVEARVEVVPDAQPVPAARPAKGDEPVPEKFTYQGRVVGPDGKPVKDAQVFLHVLSPTPQALVPRAKTDADGRFSFEIKRSEFDFRSYERSPTPWRWGHLIASAPDLGVTWAQGQLTPGKDAELKFVTDDAPIEGRLRGLQGQPVVGAKVRILWVLRSPDGDLAKWHAGLKELKSGDGPSALLGLEGLMDFALRRHGLDPAVPPAVTDKDGRFTLKGLGRERVALVRIEGEGIESRDVFVVSRSGDAKSVDAFVFEGLFRSAANPNNPQDTFLGTKFDLVVPPSRPVVGVVTDADTGKPVAGAVVCSGQLPGGVIDRYRMWTVTDADGRYTLGGAPAARGISVRVDPPAGEPYLAITAEVPDAAGLEPVKLDLKIKRGVWLLGKVLDRETKEPVQATVRYAADAENPNLKAIPGFTTEFEMRSRADDGGFRVPVLPGKGYLAVSVGSPNHPRYGIGGDVPADLPEPLRTKPFAVSAKFANAIVPLDPKADAKEVVQDVLLTPGRGVTVTILGPDGEKLKGVIASTDPLGARPDKLNDDGTLTVRGLAAKQVKYVQAVCPEKKLAGRLKVTADDKDPTLKLQPWRSMKGRVLDDDGKPVAETELQFRSIRTSPLEDEPTGFWYKGTDVKTGKDGTYQIEGLVPGATYTILVKPKGQMPRALLFRADWTPDGVKDMGDLKPMP